MEQNIYALWIPQSITSDREKPILCSTKNIILNTK